MGMTREEFAVLVKGLKAVYPDQKFIPTQDAFNAWYEFLKDLPYKVAMASVQKWVATSHFPPAISDIRQGAASLAAPQTLDAMEAWNTYVRPAISRGSYGAKESWDKFPDYLKQLITPEWILNRARDEDYNEGVEFSNFAKSYRVITERKQKVDLLPENVRTMVEDLSRKLAIGVSEDV